MTPTQSRYVRLAPGKILDLDMLREYERWTDNVIVRPAGMKDETLARYWNEDATALWDHLVTLLPPRIRPDNDVGKGFHRREAGDCGGCGL